MKRHSSAASLALAVLAILGLAGPVPAGEHVPFKGRLEGVETHTPLAPPFVMVDVEATGNATQLGQFTLDDASIVDLATRPGIGTYAFTAANGDTLTADVTGQATLIPGTAIVYIEETATITGGTGRFAGATGTFTVERFFHIAAGTTAGSFEGTITLVDDDGDDD